MSGMENIYQCKKDSIGGCPKTLDVIIESFCYSANSSFHNKLPMFKEYNQNRTFLIPPSIQDFLWENHESMLLDQLVEQLDISKLIATYKNQHGWCSAHHPRMLLKVIFYGYMTWTFSSRKLWKAVKDNLAFIYLSGGNQPDFRTISKFRKERLLVLEDIFIQIVQIANKLWLIQFACINIDGSMQYANASKHKNDEEEMLRKKIRSKLKEAEDIDDIEDAMYWDKEDGIPEELKDPEKRKKMIKEKIDEYNRRLAKTKEEIAKKEKDGIEMKRINRTDADSRLMKMKRGDFANGYNTQLASENQFIVSTYLSNNACDVNELIPSLKKIKKQYKKIPKLVVADKGYASTDNYRYLKKNKLDWYILPHTDPVDLSQYYYNKSTDTYKNKEGKVFVFKQNVWRIDRKAKRWRPKKGEKAKYRSKIYQHIEPSKWKTEYLHIDMDWIKLAWEQITKHQTSKGQVIKKSRSVDVEPIFGNIKHNFWFKQFLLRGFEWVKIERNILCIAHNLKKLIGFSIL